MKLQVRGQNIEVTQAIQGYIEQKFSKVEKHFSTPDDLQVRVLLKVYPNRIQRVEATIDTKRYILRVDERQENLYAAVDLAVDKLERQIRKNKTRINKHIHAHNKELTEDYMNLYEEEPEQIIVNKNDVVRVKHIELRPMDVEEAILQMDLIGHDFFLYKDIDVNKTCVIYRRQDGKFAILEPQ
ncbi:MAG: ribosome hibernation-promoting factor, HPF/YfiA family [Culicoidibacterales bacterium]